MSTGVSTPVVACRYGLKGSQAPGWLERHGVTVPGAPNQIARWSHNGGGRCLRLGYGEFLVEQDQVASRPAEADDVWLLLRSDFSLLLDGPQWPALLAPFCAFDFQRFEAAPDMVVMTLLAGISVTLAREPRPDGASNIALRLWCDASHQHYLQHCLRHPGETP
jgi:sarcosine oxidase subunit gamma